MKIGIDARFLTHPQRGGFKTYSENLIANLAQVDAENEYVLYLDRPPNGSTNLPERSNFSCHVVPGDVPVVGMPWREQVNLSRQVANDRIDLLHSPTLTAPILLSCPSVVTIHDMIWHSPNKFCSDRAPSPARKMMEWYYRLVPQWAARHATAVLTVSAAAKETIVQGLHLPADRVFVTHEAAGRAYGAVQDTRQLEGLRLKFNLPPAFILAIGSADPRKNISTLVEAYARLPVSLRAKSKLVIVWTHDLLEGEILNQIVRLGIKGDVCFLNGVTDEDLVLLYNAASVFVFPSRYEGFGLPILESMACGTAVLASNNSSIPEIAGNAALFAEASDVDTFTSGMQRLLTEDDLREDLVSKGRERAAGFSWIKCARQTIAVYHYALERTVPVWGSLNPRTRRAGRV